MTAQMPRISSKYLAREAWTPIFIKEELDSSQDLCLPIENCWGKRQHILKIASPTLLRITAQQVVAPQRQAGRWSGPSHGLSSTGHESGLYHCS